MQCDRLDREKMYTSNPKNGDAASSLQIARIGEKNSCRCARPTRMAGKRWPRAALQDVAVSWYEDQPYNGEIAEEQHQPDS